MAADVVQHKRSNNKFYASTFRLVGYMVADVAQ